MKKNSTLLLFFLVSIFSFSQGAIQSFTLVNADTNTDIMELAEGQAIPLNMLPTANLNIRANESGDVGSVFLRLEGPISRSQTENVAPFALYGDRGGDYNGVDMVAGDYVISAVPYESGQRGGTQGEVLDLRFSLLAETDFRPFVMTWQADDFEFSPNHPITIHTFPGQLFLDDNPDFDPGVVYNYVVDWGDGTFDTNVTGDITHNYAESGNYTVSIYGQFPRIYFGGDPYDQHYEDYGTLLSVDQWGDMQWTSMSNAFAESERMDVTATDVPDLSLVTDMTAMFYNCNNLLGNPSFNDWDVSNSTSMEFLFGNAFAFDQPLANWDVSNVTDMSWMFSGALRFNQPLEGWNVSKVTDMTAMFNGAAAFDQPLESWDMASVTKLDYMFYNASSFDRPLGAWDVSNVDSVQDMFNGAAAFDQDLGDWNVQNITNADYIFMGAGLSNSNYDNLLLAWSRLPTLQNGVIFGAPDNQYCNAAQAREDIMEEYAWIINDGGQAQDCEPMEPLPFITTWMAELDSSGQLEDNTIAVTTHPEEVYDYTVDWGDGTSNTGVTGNIAHTYDASGIYTVTISGEFPRIYFAGGGSGPNLHSDKIRTVEQWGDTQWTSMEQAFFLCRRLDVSAMDTPDLSRVGSMAQMFEGCQSLVGNSSFNNWETGNVVNMKEMFKGASSFDQNINDWDVSKVEDMAGLFAFASLYDQPLDGWDVNKVTDMSEMFWLAVNFNQSIGSWNVGNVQDMSDMFSGASSFNQPLADWDVGNVSNMSQLFAGASSFDQPLGTWNVSNVMAISSMFSDAGLSNANYDQLLNGWGQLPMLQEGLIFGANNQYCTSEEARQHIMETYGWTILDGGKAADCETIEDSVIGFALVDAETNEDLFYFRNGQEINLNDLPAGNLNVRADVSGTVESVFLQLEGPVTQSRTENFAPFALFGDISGNYHGRRMPVGEYVLSAVPYPEKEQQGEQGESLTISFSIVSDSNEVATGLRAFPNPTTTSITVEFDEPVEVQSVVLYDVLGRPTTISTSSMDGEGGAFNQATFDLSHLTRGIYFLKISDILGTIYEASIVKE